MKERLGQVESELESSGNEPSAGLPADAARSPGLRADAGAGPAFELKFELARIDVPRMKEWAHRHLRPDPHGEDGSYRVTSVYCDTPDLDVFHRSPGYRASKLRLRRYDAAPFVFLERKVKRGDQVRKRRVEVAPGDLQRLAGYVDGAIPPAGWSAGWFLEYALKKRVAPTCRVGYQRAAFYGMVGLQAVRLTIDENLIGVPARGWDAHPLAEGLDLLPGGALLELKFHDAMPELFRRLLPELPSRTARVSKYRRCMGMCGLATARGT
ncbi:MAG TPA: polyphosphate polymerase domain-containing protein [Planctomycetota bacterium]